MRIKKTDVRAQKWEYLKEATGENATTKALDQATNYHLRMPGETTAVRKEKLTELMTVAQNQGSITSEEIAEILDTDELPVQCDVLINVENK